MTERRGDQGFSVPPQRIGGRPGRPGGSAGSRRRRLGLAVVVVAAGAIVAISWLGPRLTARPNFDVSFFATPTPDAPPTRTPTPDGTVLADNVATPLPDITRPDGPVPTGRIAVQTGDLRIIDLASGTVVTGPRALAGRDAVVRSPGGDGWTCVCFDDGETTGEPARILRIVTIDASGQADAKELARYPRPVSESSQSDVATDVDLAAVAGRTHGLVAVASRDGGDSYRFSIASIDLEGRTLGRAVDLGSVGTSPTPVPSSSPDGSLELYFDGPHIRISPDGRVAFVWGMIQRVDGNGGIANDVRAWRVPLAADGSIGSVTVAPGLLQMPRFCSGVGFAAPDVLAWVCQQAGDGGVVSDGLWQIGTVGLDGEAIAGIALTSVTTNAFLEPLFDRANGQIYTWDPGFLSISRYDAHTLAGTTTSFDAVLQTALGVPAGGGTAVADWRHPISALSGSSGTITGSLDGERLYALGFNRDAAPDSGTQPSLGVFVIDRRTLALVGRWAPAASYITLTALAGGYVAASGLPGIKEDGHFAPWEASLTIHNAADGRILVRFGQLGSDGPVSVVDR